jgi:hypothetical protein
MSGFLNKAKHITGLGLDPNELYERAFEKGVLLIKFDDAADIFDKASKKFMENGNQVMSAQAAANSLLYRYLATGDTNVIMPLQQTLQGIQQIEAIGSKTEMMSVGTLAAELDCRLVEVAIVDAQNDIVKSRDLHKLARDKFQAIIRNPLITYNSRPAIDGHNDKAEMRLFYHGGMLSYYEAMTKKDVDPSAASDDLSLANQSFKRCNDQKWQQTITTLLDNWRISRTCWLCHRDMQGYQLHFSMCHAYVTPYTERILQKAKEDNSTIDIAKNRIAVCTPCGSMVTFKAVEEADKVRQELNAKLAETMRIIGALENRINRLEHMAHHH